MRGSTAVMAPAVRQEHSSSGMTRSHSTPELKPSSNPYQGQQSAIRDSVSTFDLSFDSDFELDTSFSITGLSSSTSSTPTRKPSRTRKFTTSTARTSRPSTSTTRTSTDKASETLRPPSRRQNGLPVDPKEKSRPPVSGNNRRRTGSMIERPRSWLESRWLNVPDDRPATSVGEDVTASRNLLSTGGDSIIKPDEYDPFRTKRSSWLSASRPPSRPTSPKPERVDPSTTKRSSWLSSSRPPSRPASPKRRPSQDVGSDSSLTVDVSPKPVMLRRGTAGYTMDSQPELIRRSEPAQSGPKSSRTSMFFGKFKQKQPTPLGKFNQVHSLDSDNSCASSATSLAPPASNSPIGRVSQSTSCDSNATTAATTDESSAEIPKVKNDPLWPYFKSMETEFKTFPARNTSQRVALVQVTLLPFLRSTVNHPSTKELFPEDVDGRAQILNQWWTGILEMLDGSGSNSVPGVDRPPIYEALTMLMMRAEWRQTTTSFLPLADRSPRERIRSRSYSESADSYDHAAHLAESAEHNVRTMFVSNLMKQMAFAVRKMSNRHVPLTLVTFAGKTCAYAFFFASGVADLLIRLWGQTPEQIKRTADEFGLPRVDRGESEDIVALFPPKLGIFGWRSPKAAADAFKKPPKMSVMAALINWTGPWMSRWQGRDTDLFFVFCKHFHILSDQFMPPGLPLTEKARSPAFVLVQTQLMATVNNTLHRESSLTHGGNQSLMEGMPGADASPMGMPMGSPSPDAMRVMSENRLVVLLRGFLFDHSPELARAKNTFAETFACMLKGAVRKISQFDSQACFTLCDFLEEVLVLYDEAQGTSDATGYIDWTFWLDVFGKMLQSLNTMTEVRVLSFVFTIWDMVTRETNRKEKMCLNWLLTEDNFNTFFNHWCPMVRAYYHRLLCWRICRSDDEADDVDSKIYLVVAERLKMTWAHYLYTKREAERQGRFPPSTAPMMPTPGKKFMIIRQEVNQPQPGLLVNFDQFAKTPGSDTISPGDLGIEDISTRKMAKPDGKKKRSLFQKVFGANGTETSSQAKEDSKNDAWEDEFLKARREQAQQAEQALLKARPGLPPKVQNTSLSNGSDSECSSLLFDEQKYIFRFVLAWYQPAQPPYNRVLTRPRLPAPAQAFLHSRSHSASRTQASTPRGHAFLPNRPPHPRPEASPLATSEGISSGLVNVAQNAPASIKSADADSETSRKADSCIASTLGSFLDEALEPATVPTKPKGIYAKSAAYTGRALAEWGQVAWECNNFVDRRRDEGVPGLKEVEVPILGVEGFRRMSG